METITIKNSVFKSFAYFLISLFSLGLSLIFFYFPGEPIFNYLGGFGLFFFGFLTLALVGQIFDRRPRLIIDSEGIYDRTLQSGVIDWYDIRNVYLQKIGESRFVCLDLENEEKYLPQDYQEKKKTIAVKKYLSMETVNINIDGLNIDEEELIGILKKEVANHENPPAPVSVFDYSDE